MKKSKGSLLFALLAAACFGTELLWRFVDFLRSVIDYDAQPSFIMILIWLILIGFVVTLAIRSRLGVLICAAAFALLHVYWMAAFFSTEGLWDFMGLLAYSLLIVLLILSMKEVRAVKFLWFLPAAAAFTGNLLGWIQNNYFSDLSFVWKWMLFYHLAEVLGLLFAGLWIKSTVRARDAAAAPSPGYTPPASGFTPPTPGYTPPAPGYAPPAEGAKNYPQPPAQPAATKFCGRCGGKNDADNAFCAFCGAPMKPAGPDTADWVSPLG